VLIEVDLKPATQIKKSRRHHSGSLVRGYRKSTRSEPTIE
jgi:hypothetical protein